jgi:hypothetical protein
MPRWILIKTIKEKIRRATDCHACIPQVLNLVTSNSPRNDISSTKRKTKVICTQKEDENVYTKMCTQKEASQ